MFAAQNLTISGTAVLDLNKSMVHFVFHMAFLGISLYKTIELGVGINQQYALIGNYSPMSIVRQAEFCQSSIYNKSLVATQLYSCFALQIRGQYDSYYIPPNISSGHVFKNI